MVLVYSKSARSTPLRLTPDLSTEERQALHEYAQRLGLAHRSEEDALGRRFLVISRAKGMTCIWNEGQAR